jgi:hypothetical protein
MLQGDYLENDKYPKQTSAEDHYSISREADGRRSFGEVIITNF